MLSPRTRMRLGCAAAAHKSVAAKEMQASHVLIDGGNLLREGRGVKLGERMDSVVWSIFPKHGRRWRKWERALGRCRTRSRDGRATWSGRFGSSDRVREGFRGRFGGFR